MFWLGLVLLGLGSFLLGFTNPWKFFEAVGHGFLDWTEVFWYFQWGGFWLVTASLLVFGAAGWRTPSTFSAHWKLIPPAIAVALFGMFFIFSMPEKSNQPDWKNGWLGARVYWRTKIWMRGDDRDEAALPRRMEGRWRGQGGVSFTISRDSIRITTPDGETERSARTCRARFVMEYDFTFRSALAQQAMEPGLAFEPLASVLQPSYATDLPDRRFPRLICYCGSESSTWILVDIDRLLAFPDGSTALIAKRR